MIHSTNHSLLIKYRVSAAPLAVGDRQFVCWGEVEQRRQQRQLLGCVGKPQLAQIRHFLLLVHRVHHLHLHCFLLGGHLALYSAGTKVSGSFVEERIEII
jgi:hypothetical protein